MKTPWRFLADLTSRRKPQLIQASASERDSKTGDPENLADSAIPSVQIADELPMANEAPTELEGSRGSRADDENFDRPVADGSAPVPANAVKALPKALRTKTARDARQADAPVEPRTVAGTHDDQAIRSTPSQGSPFFDEVTNLDHEIKQMREELARKLSVQNAQLKKMLERFNVS